MSQKRTFRSRMIHRCAPVLGVSESLPGVVAVLGCTCRHRLVEELKRQLQVVLDPRPAPLHNLSIRGTLVRRWQQRKTVSVLSDPIPQLFVDRHKVCTQTISDSMHQPAIATARCAKQGGPADASATGTHPNTASRSRPPGHSTCTAGCIASCT